MISNILFVVNLAKTGFSIQKISHKLFKVFRSSVKDSQCLPPAHTRQTTQILSIMLISGLIAGHGETCTLFATNQFLTRMTM